MAENPYTKKIEDLNNQIKEVKSELKKAKDDAVKKTRQRQLDNLNMDLQVAAMGSARFEREHVTKDLIETVNRVEAEVKISVPTDVGDLKTLKALLKSTTADAKDVIKRISALKKMIKG